jgi:hypothetical protein
MLHVRDNVCVHMYIILDVKFFVKFIFKYTIWIIF